MKKGFILASLIVAASKVFTSCYSGPEKQKEPIAFKDMATQYCNSSREVVENWAASYSNTVSYYPFVQNVSSEIIHSGPGYYCATVSWDVAIFE